MMARLALDIAQMLVQAHAHVILVDHRIALGMEGEEVDRRIVVDHMLEEAAQECLRLGIGEGAAGVRAADTRLGQDASSPRGR